MRSRILSILLCAMMVAAVLPVSADPLPTVPNGYTIEVFYSGPELVSWGGLAIDGSDNLFVSQRWDYNVPPGTVKGAIYKITPEGILSTFATVAAERLAFNSQGELFGASAHPLLTSEIEQNRVYKIVEGDTPGTVEIYAYPEDPLVIRNINGIAFDSSDVLYVGNEAWAGYGRGDIWRTLTGGVLEKFAETDGPPYDSTEALAFDSSGILYANTGYPISGDILRILPDGTVSIFIAKSGAPWDRCGPLAFDPMGNLLHGTGTIFSIDPSGEISTFATGFSFNTDMAFNSAGELFVVDGSVAPIIIYKIAPKPLRPVGGVIMPVNKLAILAPYLALMGLVGTVITVVVVRRKRSTTQFAGQ